MRRSKKGGDSSTRPIVPDRVISAPHGPDAPVGPDSNGVSVADWLEAYDPEAALLDSGAWGAQRLKRLHGEQMVLDVIAHVQNIPLRLLRVGNLEHLDDTFVRFVARWQREIHSLFTETYPDLSAGVPQPLGPSEADRLLRAMREPRHLALLRDWVLRLADPHEPETEELLRVPPSLPTGYAEWFLMLLPHVERDVWLTEMGNPLPAHTLARMVEHCSLYILMWAWSNAGRFRVEFERLKAIGDQIEPYHLTIMDRTLGFPHLGAIVMPAFCRRGRERSRDIALLAGPFLLEAATSTGSNAWFVEPLLKFLGRIERVRGVQGWNEVRDKAPGRAELQDALESRAALDRYEAPRRALQSLHALRRLRAARLDSSITRWKDGRVGRPISRANWETMAVLSAWFDRWGWVVYDAREPSRNRALAVSIDRHRVSLLVTGVSARPELLFYGYDRPEDSPVDCSHWAVLDESLEGARKVNGWRWIEGPSTFFARMRERQHAAWTAHVAAIHHLLARHSPRDRPEGADNPDSRQMIPASCEEADHLLRGFGGRVCRYLLSMARAEAAVIYWLDYSSDPPQLRHVGSAERLIQHRARRQAMLTTFDQYIWEAPTPGRDATLRRGVDIGTHSPWQVYRAAASGQIEPQPEDRKAQRAQVARPPGRLDVFDPGSRPEDAVSVPLLFNDRVVGVFGLAGIASSRHFDLRLYPALRLVGQVLAQAMYFHSQVWQMRQINWLASHVSLEEWRRHDRENHFNPLRRVARCVANVFLCPGVQIWLVDKQNPSRFLLHGNTAPEIFEPDGEAPEHAPHLRVKASRSNSGVDLSRSLLAFAVDQWARTMPDTSSPSATGAAPGRNDERMRHGQFVQAQFVGGSQATVGYGLAAAERGDLLLQQDFLDASASVGGAGSDALPTLRRALYVEREWSQTMSFALIRGDSTSAEVVGIVGLFALAMPGDSRPLWPPGWRPVVAHMQTYLPYVFMQTEAIANPLDDLRRYLLHEGRNELNATSEQAGQLKRSLLELVTVDPPVGMVRPWLRKWRPLVEKNPFMNAGDLLPGLQQLDKSIADVAEKVEKLMSVERAENMAMLGRLIERQREISGLGLDFNRGERVHDMRWLPLRAGLHDLLSSYAADLKKQRVWWSVDQVPESVELLTQPRMWHWLLGDLVHNLVKYANPDSGAEVHLDIPHNRDQPCRLRLRNESSYDAALDLKERLVLHGVQGSAGLARRTHIPIQTKVSRLGMGIGLWGVNLLAQALHLTLEIDVVPQRRPNQALYRFDLVIPRDLIRPHR